MKSMIELSCVCLCLAGSAFAQPTERVSVSSDGSVGNDDSGELAGWTQPTIVSSGGRYVFFGSRASNLVPNDTNNKNDVFRRDRRTGQTIRMSVGSNGEQLDHDSILIDASELGIAALFATRAAVLPDLDDNGEFDLYVRRINRDTTALASARSNGQAAGAFFGAMSDTGNRVAFASASDRVVIPWDENGVTDVFLRDIQEHTTLLCSRNAAGELGNDHSGADPSGAAIGVGIAGDGSAVAFTSLASNLVANDGNGQADVFYFDPHRGLTLRLSETREGRDANGASSVGPFSVSWDGRLVLFRSDANDLVPGDTGFADIFLWGGSRIRRVSETSTGGQANGDSFLGGVSRQGEVISFLSAASNLVPDDTNDRIDVFVRRLAKDRLQRVNVSYTGGETTSPRNPGYGGYLSDGGDYVGFTSRASNLVRDAADSGCAHAYVRDLFSVELEGLPIASAPVRFRFENALGGSAQVGVVLISCSGTEGIALPGGRHVPLTFDSWTAAGLSVLPLLSATLLGNGLGWTPTYPFPAVPSGVRIWIAGLTLNPTTQRIEQISGPGSFVTL